MERMAGSAHERSSRWFPSRRDTWLVLTIWSVVALLGWTAYLTLTDGNGRALERAAIVAALTGTAAFALWVLYGTRYRVGRRDLLIRSGPFR